MLWKHRAGLACEQILLSLIDHRFVRTGAKEKGEGKKPALRQPSEKPPFLLPCPFLL